MRTCKEISTLVSESLDRELSLRERMAMRVHLMMCSLCRTYSRQIGQLRSILQGAAKAEPPPEPLPEEVRQRIRQRLSDESR
ncbi:zf-HC2 domain-containing protein [Pontiella agarivorans]|uniref:Zf-HC2 domain-containing protein n=1 Tax=Pontiella agarivorans TaxID=3038953 RepID=A0ABU5MVK3_9BACT|nr:zf-HC2 domain-containing protein [Pontiella agarivorans]MDZ8118218.1 zf-HC2 domain-containing protein [Pontiella agarivorans]